MEDKHRCLFHYGFYTREKQQMWYCWYLQRWVCITQLPCVKYLRCCPTNQEDKLIQLSKHLNTIKYLSILKHDMPRTTIHRLCKKPILAKLLNFCYGLSKINVENKNDDSSY